MARRSKRSDSEKLRQSLITLLIDFEHKLNQDNLREQVQSLMPAHHQLRDLGSSLIHEEDAESAKGRVLAYLRKYPATLLHGDELMIVAGISEYARRIRELRKEMGWPILSGQALKDMVADGDLCANIDNYKKVKTDTYYLIEDRQDIEAAYRWNLANEIRKSDQSVKIKILEYLRKNIGKKVTGEELKYLAKDRSEWARRVRELRTEEGWPIMTCNTGMPELAVGVYILTEDRQAKVHDRKIPDPVRIAVLTRDSFCCKKCGWNPEKRNSGDKLRNFLELHHIEHHVNGGKNEEDNLITLCNVCHDDVHRGNSSEAELFKLIGVNIKI
ncbi:HNH endonuclease [Psychromonas aquimarina]|uniref:HNH endonuclease n=1 Tax=Psychromonas aquimarina TaxID=444919 RepID=UPI00048CDAF7|nr:HNH endonuclease signature motif containing protein [Psychromonas aquimarina]